MAIVQPEMVVAWHRDGFRLFWTWKVRRGQPGRPFVPREVRDLIRKMCRENSEKGLPIVTRPTSACAKHTLPTPASATRSLVRPIERMSRSPPTSSPEEPTILDIGTMRRLAAAPNCLSAGRIPTALSAFVFLPTSVSSPSFTI